MARAMKNFLRALPLFFYLLIPWIDSLKNQHKNFLLERISLKQRSPKMQQVDLVEQHLRKKQAIFSIGAGLLVSASISAFPAFSAEIDVFENLERRLSSDPSTGIAIEKRQGQEDQRKSSQLWRQNTKEEKTAPPPQILESKKISVKEMETPPKELQTLSNLAPLQQGEPKILKTQSSFIPNLPFPSEQSPFSIKLDDFISSESRNLKPFFVRFVSQEDWYRFAGQVNARVKEYLKNLNVVDFQPITFDSKLNEKIQNAFQSRGYYSSAPLTAIDGTYAFPVFGSLTLLLIVAVLQSQIPKKNFPEADGISSEKNSVVDNPVPPSSSEVSELIVPKPIESIPAPKELLSTKMLEDVEKRVSELESKLAGSLTDLKSAEKKITDLEREMEAVTSQKEQAHKENQNLRSQLKEAVQEKDNALKKNKELTFQMNELASLLEKEKKTLQSTTQALEAMKAYEQKLQQLQETNAAPQFEEGGEAISMPVSQLETKKGTRVKIQKEMKENPPANTMAEGASPPSAVSLDDDAWKALTSSQLKKKTVPELSDFLSKRNIAVVDASGKPLKKPNLLSAVDAYLGVKV